MSEDNESLFPAVEGIELSPLNMLALEIHEMYGELSAVGFTSDQLSGIFGHLVLDAITSRIGSTSSIDFDEEEYEEDDDDSDGDYS